MDPAPPQRGTVIVTGSSRGIGAAVARLLGAHGYRIVVNFVRQAAAAHSVAQTIVDAGGQAIALRGDVAREDEVLALFEGAERAFGPLSGLVNNAGLTGGFARLEDLTHAALLHTLSVNVAGTILCAREAVRRMSARRGAPVAASLTSRRWPRAPGEPTNGCITQPPRAPSTVSRSAWRGRSRRRASA